MKLDITIDGKETTLTTTFVSGLVYRKYIELSEQGMLNNLTLEAREKVVELIVEAFGNKFTANQFWNGVDARDIDVVILNFCDDLRMQTKNEGKLNELREETKD